MVISPYSVTRAIAAALLFLILGLLFANAKSTSHELVEHTQHVGSTLDLQSGDHDLESSDVLDIGGAGYSHDHNPADHTHDIPLRFLLAVALPAFMPNWEASPTSVLYSVPSFPLERPPKVALLA